MSPSHVVLVVEAAWLLLSLVFKQDDPCAAALQVTQCTASSSQKYLGSAELPLGYIPMKQRSEQHYRHAALVR
jgi:hypothetical protein